MEIDFDIFLKSYTAPKSFLSEFFWRLTKEQAKVYLHVFLGKRQEYLDRLWSQLLLEGIISNPEVVFEDTLLDRIVDWVVQKAVQEGKARFFEVHGYPFSPDLKAMMVGAGFYLGEWIIRRYSDFRWKVGDRPVKRYVLQNVPVVSNQVGDYDGSDLCPIQSVMIRCAVAAGNPDRRWKPFTQMVMDFVERARNAR